MKANYSSKTGMGKKVVLSEKEIQKALDAEWENKVDEVYNVALRDVSAQVLAVFYTCLSKKYGFGKKRMLALKRDVEATFTLMNTNNILGKDFTTQDCLDYMKKEFGIDLDKENMYASR